MVKNFLALFAIVLAGVSFGLVMAEDNKQQEQFFDANQLQVENLYATLNIHVVDQNGISVRMHGPDRLKESVKVDLNGDKLHLTQHPTATGNIFSTTINHDQGESQSIVSINGQTIIVKGSGVTVVENIISEKLVIDVIVPPGTPLSLYDLMGDAQIGDVLAPLQLITSADVNIGQVTRATVDVSRAADVQIEQVSEQLDVKASGNADLKINSGEVKQLNIQAENNADTEFNGKALNAELSATDNSEISVAHVVNEPRISVSRNADIHIKNRK